MNKSLLLLLSLIFTTGAFAQQYGTLLVADYDDVTRSVEGVSIYAGKELLGTTDHVGSFKFTKKFKGTLTLSHPDYQSKELKFQSKKELVVETNIVVRQEIYDSLKTMAEMVLYKRCIPENRRGLTMTSEGSSISSEAFNEYIRGMMRYPNRARDNGEEGTVEMQFMLDERGIVTCVQINKGVSYELDKEAFRILASMPQWAPAKRNGTPVPAIYNVPIEFKLEK